MRCGLIAQKMGMTRVFTDEGKHIPVTVLRVEDCQVVAVRNQEKDGYTAMQLGAGAAKVKRLSKAERERFAKANVTPKQRLAEFRVSEDAVVEVGQQLAVTVEKLELEARRISLVPSGAAEEVTEKSWSDKPASGGMGTFADLLKAAEAKKKKK